MGDQTVFAVEKEIERLGVQYRLLSSIEKPLFASIFSGRSNLSVLDVGCNDGKKTISLFSDKSIKSVVGIEYNPSLAREAETVRGDDKFFFLSLDASSDDFPSALRSVMEERKIESFDCIYLSFVLMHLSEPGKLLSVLSSFLSTDGVIVIVEADDASSRLTGDSANLLGTFLEILKEDKYSGNRTLGGMLEAISSASGYEVTRICDSIGAGKGETEKKEMIYTTFFSYLEEDVDLLLTQEDIPLYRNWKKWLLDNLPSLKALILDDKSEISMGMKILALRRKNEA